MATSQLYDAVLAADKGVFAAKVSEHERELRVNIECIGKGDAFDSVETTASTASWSLYSSPNPANSTHLCNRAKGINITSDGQALKVGSQIFTKAHKQGQKQASFTPKDFSLYLDHIERHNQYLFVTSRQRVITVPEPEEKKPKDSSDPTSSSKSANSSQKAKEDDGISSSEPEDEVDPEKLDSESDRSEMSACESWSEASTEYSSDGPAEELRSETAKPDSNTNGGEHDESTGDSDNSSDSNDCVCPSHEQESDNDSIAGDGDRFVGTQIGEGYSDMDSDLYNNDDGFRPASDSDNDSDGARRISREAWDESGFILFRKYDDFDWDSNDFVPEGDSDSDDCSACGDSGDAACTLPNEIVESGSDSPPADMKDVVIPLGTSMAQLRVYDMSKVDETGNYKRVFHYKCSTMSLIRDSPPVVHARKSLVVWPLGDQKILFADYKYNTYFIKRIRPSRMLAQQVCIDSRFSSNGRYLHVAGLELRGSLPKRPKKNRDQSKKTPDKSNQRAEPKKLYDVVLYTYRLSAAKTSRAPPTLLHRQVLPIGTLEHVLPSFVWTEETLFLGCRVAPTQLKVFRLPMVIKWTRKDESVAALSSPLTIDLPAWAVDREVKMFADEARQFPDRGLIVVKPEVTKPKTTSEKVDGGKSEEDKNVEVEGSKQYEALPVPTELVDGTPRSTVSDTTVSGNGQLLMVASIPAAPTSNSSSGQSTRNWDLIDLSQDHMWANVGSESAVSGRSSV